MQRSATGTVIAILIGVTGLLFDTTAHAQYTADYQTNIISGVASNWAGNYILGYANNADVLVIESGGVMSNVNGYVGGPQFITNSVPIPGGSNDVAMVSVTLQVRGRALVNDLVAALTELRGVDAVLADDVNSNAE